MTSRGSGIRTHGTQKRPPSITRRYKPLSHPSNLSGKRKSTPAIGKLLIRIHNERYD